MSNPDQALLSNEGLIKKSKGILSANYSKVMLPYFLLGLLLNFLTTPQLYTYIFEYQGLLAAIFLGILATIIYAIIQMGFASFSLHIAKEEGFEKNRLLAGFTIFQKTLLITVIYLFIVILGLILLLVPGFIFALMFSQVYYLALKNPNKSVIDLFKESASLMMGHKSKLFLLWLWYGILGLVGLFTLGIYYLWLIPQYYTTLALFHEMISSDTIDFGIDHLKGDFVNTQE